MINNKKSINIYIDYKVNSAKKYLGNSFPPLIYKYFKSKKNYNVYSLLDKKLPKIDICIIINGGSHWTYKDFKVNNFDFKQLLIWTFPKFKNYYFIFFYFFKKNINLIFKRFLFENKSYEKHLENLISKNPNVKIIHRLDGIYQVICKNYGYDYTVQSINKNADVTVYQSLYSKNAWESGVKTIFGITRMINPVKSVIIDNGVDKDIFKLNTKKIKLRGKWKILNISASPSPKKGLYKILELAHSLRNNPDFQFYLIGNQINDPLFGKYISEYNNITFLSTIYDRDKISSYYRSCDIFIFPSEDDCSPNVILEAISLGLPILTINSGGIKDLIIKDKLCAGLFLDDKNPVSSLLHITKYYSKFRKDALKLSEYFSYTRMGRDYEKIIIDLIKK